MPRSFVNPNNFLWSFPKIPSAFCEDPESIIDRENGEVEEHFLPEKADDFR